MRDLLVRGQPGRGRPGAGRARRASASPSSTPTAIELRAFHTGRGKDLLDLLTFGAEVDVCMGYGDARVDAARSLSGMITEITTNFPEAGTPELSIAGYDHGFPLTIGKNSRTWTKARDSDAAHEIASFHNLNAQSRPPRSSTRRSSRTRRATASSSRSSPTAITSSSTSTSSATLHFAQAERQGDGGGDASPGAKACSSFKPEANLAGQIAKVEVYGWDPKTKEDHRRHARAPARSPGLNGKSARPARSTLRARSVEAARRCGCASRCSRRPKPTQRAKAALNERAKQVPHRRGRGASACPRSGPIATCSSTSSGAPFSKTYYIQQATHKIDGSGYRTRFKVKETAL